MTQSTVDKEKPRTAARPVVTRATGARDPRDVREPRRPGRTVATSRTVRRPSVPLQPTYTPPNRLFNWGEGLTKAEREAVKERMAVIGLSGILVFTVLLIGGLLFWNKIIVARRPVLAVDGHTVTLRQYADILAYRQNVLQADLAQAQQLAGQPQTDPSQINPVAQMAQQQVAQIQSQLGNLSTQLVEDLINDQLVREEAQKRGITVSQDEVKSELEKLVGYQDPNATPTPAPTAAATPDPALAADASVLPAATAELSATATAVATAQPTTTPNARARRNDSFDARYKDYLRVMAGSDAVVRSDVETELLRQKLNDRLGADVPATQEQVHARHILVADEATANSVLQRLNNGESFEALAAELSLDTSNKDQGGDLGWFPHGVMVSDFEDAAFKLQPGQLSPPVKTQFGYHIIRVDERDPNRPVDPQMLSSLKANAIQKWLDDEQKNHQIARFYDSDKQQWAVTNGPKPRAPRA